MIDATKLAFLDVSRDDELRIVDAAHLVQQQSWGPGYPLAAVDVFEAAEYVVVAQDGDVIIGTACLTRYLGCPDDRGNVEAWIAGWVVDEAYHGHGCGTQILRKILAYAMGHRKEDERYIFASVDTDENEHILKRALFRCGISERQIGEERKAKNEDGRPTKILWIRLW